MHRNLQRGMGNMGCSFCEEDRRVPAEGFWQLINNGKLLKKIAKVLKYGSGG